MSYSPLYFDKRNAYRTNGSGRDMYIYTTNGGYSNKPITFPFDPMNYHHNTRSLMTLPSIPCKTLHYGPDGTGRDTYIKTDEGGNLPNFSSISIRKQEFISSLRGYEQKKCYNPEDWFRRSQMLLPVKEAIKVHDRLKIQRNLVNRLTKHSKSSHLHLPAIEKTN